jgi:hypothetical protein
MDDVVETKIPLMDMPLGDLANDENLLPALRHTLGTPSPRVATVTPAPGTAFQSGI